MLDSRGNSEGARDEPAIAEKNRHQVPAMLGKPLSGSDDARLSRIVGAGTSPSGQLVGFSEPTTHMAKNCEPPP
jgi:hypothetical protein